MYLQGYTYESSRDCNTDPSKNPILSDLLDKLMFFHLSSRVDSTMGSKFNQKYYFIVRTYLMNTVDSSFLSTSSFQISSLSFSTTIHLRFPFSINSLGETTLSILQIVQNRSYRLQKKDQKRHVNRGTDRESGSYQRMSTIGITTKLIPFGSPLQSYPVSSRLSHLTGDLGLSTGTWARPSRMSTSWLTPHQCEYGREPH